MELLEAKCMKGTFDRILRQTEIEARCFKLIKKICIFQQLKIEFWWRKCR